MREKRYTEGPWKVNESAYCHVFTGVNRGIANCGTYSDSHNHNKVSSENVANTHLIAAAPELLEALEELVFLTSQSRDEETVKANVVARQAISKACGEDVS